MESTIDKLMIGLEEEYKQARKVDKALKKNLDSISQHFCEYSKKCDALSKELLQDINSGELGGIHSANRRVKNIESILRKIVKKKGSLPKEPNQAVFNETEKYRGVNSNNYYKIVTDLIGLRILIRYRQEWKAVDKWIRGKFPANYITDWINDYDPNPSRSFIAEKPKIYYKYADKELYEQIDNKSFDLRESKEGYNSIHYIINYQGNYVELQVRTILDEAWSECTHDVVYKGDRKNRLLGLLAKTMSDQIKAAETISGVIYEVINPEQSEYIDNEGIDKNDAVDKDDAIDNQTRFASRIDRILEKKLGV